MPADLSAYDAYRAKLADLQILAQSMGGIDAQLEHLGEQSRTIKRRILEKNCEIATDISRRGSWIVDT